ncbi:MAG: 3-phosphoserine/phosphohydroxythreonine transaminase [Bacteroidales bacterium]|nr:3-phosphoserine/phosphohydroxythreonine transaminase [Bacteroidales bacterium]
MKTHNFSAGPAVLPQVAIENTAKAILDLNGIGLSLIEISHRSKDFQAVIDEAVALMKELLGLPEGYHVLFLGGGASTQFATIPMNFLKTKAAYLETGVWAKKAAKESKGFGETVIVASSADKNFNYIPKNYVVPSDADYFHITTNNTIYGTEIRTDIDSSVPLIADMSSDFLSRPTDISKYVMVYGGAQKNIGPAGATFVIIKEDFMNNIANRHIPTMFKYATHTAEGSMFNTPPVMPIFTIKETLKWLKSLGGLKAIEKMNIEKANILYDAIDSSRIFMGTAELDSRSLMNICFVMKPEYAEKEEAFMSFSKSKGMSGIKGHRSVGGFRASTYNALPKESVMALVDCMKEFERTV